MRTISSITLALFTSLLAAGCVATDEPADRAGDAVSEIAASIDVTPVLLCPDQHDRLRYPPSSCSVNGHDGLQTCTDHITFHYVAVFRVPTFPPGPSYDCVLTGTDVTTTCTQCTEIVVHIP
jgi:hypothetical protein